MLDRPSEKLVAEQVAELARSARGGDKSAFAKLVECHQHMVYCLAYQHAVDKTEAEDIAQEAFLRAYRDLAKLRDPAAFAPWLYRIAINVSHEYVRTHHPAVSVESVAEPPAKEREEEAREDRLLAMVSELPEKYRIPLTLHYVKGLKYDEMEKELGLPSSTLRSRVHRAKAKLRRMIARRRN